MGRARLNPTGYSVYIMVCADDSYYTGMCGTTIKEELLRAARGEIRHFRKPERFPVRVGFKESKLSFREAYIKCKYLRKLNRIYRKKLMETKIWPAGKLLEPLILEKMGDHFENNGA